MQDDGSDRNSVPVRPGRPQDPERGDAILRVTLELLGERGFASLTVGEIVSRARVSKSTIYRRWATKEELVLAAFDRLPELQVKECDDPIDALLALVEQYNVILHSTPLGTVLPGLMAEATRNPTLATGLQSVIARRQEPARIIVERAIERGALPAATDSDLAMELVMAPLFYRSFLESEHLEKEDFRRIYSIIFAGLNISAGRRDSASEPSDKKSVQPIARSA